jgi:hypothetical protein
VIDNFCYRLQKDYEEFKITGKPKPKKEKPITPKKKESEVENFTDLIDKKDNEIDDLAI